MMKNDIRLPRAGIFRIRNFDPYLDMFTIEVGDEVCLLTYCRMMELHRTLRANLTKAEKKMLPPLNLQFDDLLRSPLNPWTVGAVVEVGLPPTTKTLIYNKGVQIYRYSKYAEYGDVLYRLETRHFSGKQYLKRTYWIDAELLMDNISPDKITKEQEAIIEDYQKYIISFWTSKLKENYDSTTLDKIIKLETIVENFLDDLDGVDVPVKKKSRKISLTKTGKLTKSTLDHCEPLSDDLATFGEEEKPQMNWRIRKKGWYEVEDVRKSLENGELYFYTEDEIQKMRDLNDKMYGDVTL